MNYLQQIFAMSLFNPFDIKVWIFWISILLIINYQFKLVSTNALIILIAIGSLLATVNYFKTF